MESLFSESFPASLQFVTFPLELTGLLLALIEVRFPHLAERLTRWIVRLSVPMRALRSGRNGKELVMERSLQGLLSRVLPPAFYIIAAIYLGKLIYQFMHREPALDWLIGISVSFVVTVIAMTVALVVLSVVAFFLVVSGSDFARRFVAGRAIGTLGILIAGLGLMGEFYQLLVQLIH